MAATKRISLWSGPRNISTTLMYSFAQRSDTKVFDEPLYAHYLSNSDAISYHPGAEDVLCTQENDGDKVIAQMLNNKEAPVLFFKNMTHHLLELDRTFLKNMVNVLLTRDPREMLPSYAAVIDEPQLHDVGYGLHCELVDYFNEHQIPFVVLDSTKVLLDPRKQLQLLCGSIGIPFQEQMLNWEKGSREEDGIWAPYWYANIHKSTGFKKYTPKTAPFPEKLLPLLEECTPYYHQLKKLAI